MCTVNIYCSVNIQYTQFSTTINVKSSIVSTKEHQELTHFISDYRLLYTALDILLQCLPPMNGHCLFVTLQLQAMNSLSN